MLHPDRVTCLPGRAPLAQLSQGLSLPSSPTRMVKLRASEAQLSPCSAGTGVVRMSGETPFLAVHSAGLWDPDEAECAIMRAEYAVMCLDQAIVVLPWQQLLGEMLS